MPENESEFVTSFKVAADVFKVIADAVYDEGGTDEHIRRLLTDAELRTEVAKKIAGYDPRLVREDEERALRRAISAGRFDRVHEDITARKFPPEADDVSEDIGLVHFDEELTTPQVIQYLLERSLRPAKLRALLKYAANHPEEQREFPIVALGTSWLVPGDGHVYPFLYGDRDNRGLSLMHQKSGGERWVERCRFLAAPIQREIPREKTEAEKLDLLIKAGQYDWESSEITAELFPPDPDDVAEGLELVQCTKVMTTPQVLVHLAERGLRPAKLRGLLRYGAENPEHQRHFPIFAIGATVKLSSGSRVCPYLTGSEEKRSLGLGPCDDRNLWIENCRFLAIRMT